MKRFIQFLSNRVSLRAIRASRLATLKGLDALTPLSNLFHQTSIWIKNRTTRVLTNPDNLICYRQSGFVSFGPIQDETGAITISSDGDLCPDDTLRSTAQDIIHTGKTIYDTNLKLFFESDVFKILKKAKTQLPVECLNCVWKNICVGGEPVNRYSKEKQFDNPSIYCNSLKNIYEYITANLLYNGANKDTIMNVLGKEIY